MATIFSEERTAISAFIDAARKSCTSTVPGADYAAAVGSLEVMLCEAVSRLSDEQRGAMLRIMDASMARYAEKAQAEAEARQ